MAIQVHLFGRFSALRGDRKLDKLSSSRVQALFSYLLLYRDRQHVREALADVLWEDCSGGQSRKYLRQALWRLQDAIEEDATDDPVPVLTMEGDWVGINRDADLWLDVAIFERSFRASNGTPDAVLDPDQARTLREAVELYRGDLLAESYEDWCLFERERLQNMYLAMLEKLMSFCEAHHEYESGLDYGTRSLRIDHARECTHRAMMRHRYLGGDRTGALRQYERCSAALEAELGVQPSAPTAALCAQIREDSLLDYNVRTDVAGEPSPPPGLIGRLDAMHHVLCEVQNQVQELQREIRQLVGHLC